MEGKISVCLNLHLKYQYLLVREAGEAGDRPESVHSKPTPLAVTKHNSYVESREFIHSLDGKEREPGSEVGFWTLRVLKIFLLGFRIQAKFAYPYSPPPLSMFDQPLRCFFALRLHFDLYFSNT